VGDRRRIEACGWGTHVVDPIGRHSRYLCRITTRWSELGRGEDYDPLEVRTFGTFSHWLLMELKALYADAS